MIVKELKEFIKNLPDDMEIVINDTYDRGLPPTYPLKVEDRVWDDNLYKPDEKRIPEKCLIISVDERFFVSPGSYELYLKKDFYNDEVFPNFINKDIINGK